MSDKLVNEVLSEPILNYTDNYVYALCMCLDDREYWKEFLVTSGKYGAGKQTEIFKDAEESRHRSRGCRADYIIRYLGAHECLTVHETLSILQRMGYQRGLNVFPEILRQLYPITTTTKYNNTYTTTDNNASTTTDNNAYTKTDNNAYTTTDNNAYTTTYNNASTTTDNNAYTTTDNNAYTTTDNNAYTTTDNNASTTTDNNAYTTTDNNASTTTDNNASRTCSDKIALLIGNSDYDDNTLTLHAPKFDVQTLSELLTTRLGFRVVSLVNLRKTDIEIAIEAFNFMLNDGVYGLFFYSGHGFETGGMQYIIPTDIHTSCENPQDSCVAISYILDRMQSKHTSLNVIILDMCRDMPFPVQGMSTVDMPQLDTRGNTIIGYATGSGRKSWEDIRICKHSLYANSLLKFISKPIPVRDILLKTSQDIEKCAGGSLLQNPVTVISQWRDCCLTDRRVFNIDVGHDVWGYSHSMIPPLTPSPHTYSIPSPSPISLIRRDKSLLLLILLLLLLLELPSGPTTLSYSSGISVKLGFAALYSNVLIIYLQLQSTLKYITEYNAFIVDSSITDEIVSSQKLINIPSPNNQDIRDQDVTHQLMDHIFPIPQGIVSEQNYSVSVLSNLERLTQPLLFRVYCEWFNENLDQRETEVYQVSIPSPLVTRLWRHHNKYIPQNNVTEPTVNVMPLNIV